MFNVSSDLNPDKCQAMCKEAGFRFAAVSFQVIVSLYILSSTFGIAGFLAPLCLHDHFP